MQEFYDWCLSDRYDTPEEEWAARLEDLKGQVSIPQNYFGRRLLALKRELVTAVQDEACDEARRLRRADLLVSVLVMEDRIASSFWQSGTEVHEDVLDCAALEHHKSVREQDTRHIKGWVGQAIARELHRQAFFGQGLFEGVIPSELFTYRSDDEWPDHDETLERLLLDGIPSFDDSGERRKLIMDSLPVVTIIDCPALSDADVDYLVDTIQEDLGDKIDAGVERCADHIAAHVASRALGADSARSNLAARLAMISCVHLFGVDKVEVERGLALPTFYSMKKANRPLELAKDEV